MNYLPYQDGGRVSSPAIAVTAWSQRRAYHSLGKPIIGLGSDRRDCEPGADAGASDATRTLADRAANAGIFDAYLYRTSRYPFGREPDGSPSQSWTWHEPTM
jgi:hypothetical protein